MHCLSSSYVIFIWLAHCLKVCYQPHVSGHPASHPLLNCCPLNPNYFFLCHVFLKPNVAGPPFSFAANFRIFSLIYRQLSTISGPRMKTATANPVAPSPDHLKLWTYFLSHSRTFTVNCLVDQD